MKILVCDPCEVLSAEDHDMLASIATNEPMRVQLNGEFAIVLKLKNGFVKASNTTKVSGAGKFEITTNMLLVIPAQNDAVKYTTNNKLSIEVSPKRWEESVVLYDSRLHIHDISMSISQVSQDDFDFDQEEF